VDGVRCDREGRADQNSNFHVYVKKSKCIYNHCVKGFVPDLFTTIEW
jgi:hypothetical protein